jgi:phage terminase large subunit-like protein
MSQVNEYALVKNKVMIEKYQEHEANDMKSWLKINPVLKMSVRCQPHTSTFAR